MALVLLHRFFTSVEATMVRSRLRAEGIESFLFDVEATFDTADRMFAPIRLMVAEEDLERAAQTLTAAFRGDFRLDEDSEG